MRLCPKSLACEKDFYLKSLRTRERARIVWKCVPAAGSNGRTGKNGKLKSKTKGQVCFMRHSLVSWRTTDGVRGVLFATSHRRAQRRCRVMARGGGLLCVDALAAPTARAVVVEIC